MNIQDDQKALRTPRPRHWARRTHRVLGMTSLVFLVFISVSGLVLNHADGLGLSRHAAAPWLLQIYGIEPPPVDSAFSVRGVLFATSAGGLYANGRELANGTGKLIGAAEADNDIVVATSNEFFVTTADGELIERFASEDTVQMLRLGTVDKNVIVEVLGRYSTFDPNTMGLSDAEETAPRDVTWSQSSAPSDEQLKQISMAAVGQAMNWERVLLDFHSGRILPVAGRYIADLTALSILYMCFSGILLWVRRR